MKTKKSITNSLISIFQYVILIIIGFVSQRLFIKILNVEYLGLNGLFTNIISMLGIVELGIGSAIIYNLYKPIENNDYKTINSLMKFYKNAYNLITIIILILGISFIPFLPLFISNVTLKVNIIFVYLLFILDIVASYILSYKRSILYADQKNYIVNIIHIISTILLNIFQLLYLYITKDYYGYLIIKILFRLFENIMISIYVNNKYNKLDINNADELDKNILSDIIKKIKALFFHKVGSFVVLGTDNIIISKFLGLITVGLYSNYYLVINALYSLFGESINALTPSVGHLLVEEDSNKNYNVFKKIRFINFWIATFSGIGLLLIMKPFITIWLGKEFLLSTITLIVLVFNYYQQLMRNTYLSFKNAAGIYYEDRFVPLLESITNIIASIILVKIIGLPGVFIGTIISSLWLWCYSYPKYVYKELFKRNYINYYKETIGYTLLFIVISVISYIISSVININNIVGSLSINLLLTILIPNIIIYILFRNSDNFIYFKNLIKNKIKHTK